MHSWLGSIFPWRCRLGWYFSFDSVVHSKLHNCVFIAGYECIVTWHPHSTADIDGCVYSKLFWSRDLRTPSRSVCHRFWLSCCKTQCQTCCKKSSVVFQFALVLLKCYCYLTRNVWAVNRSYTKSGYTERNNRSGVVKLSVTISSRDELAVHSTAPQLHFFLSLRPIIELFKSTSSS